MAKLPRKTQKIFCSKPTAENQTSVFGTMKTADKQYSTDVGTLQSNAAYEQGWKSATIASYKPFMEDFNTLNYINTSQLAYLFQQGIPEWDEATAYYKNSFCSYNGDLWQSLIDDNLGNAPFEGDEWTLFTSKNKGGGLELCDIGTALYVDETKGLRRYLNGQIVDINTNTQAFLNRLQKITTLHPSLLCTEEEWQTAKTMSAFEQVGKFVFNYSGDDIVSVRLPRVVNVQGLFDLQNLGMTVSAGLPNITGTFASADATSSTGNLSGAMYKTGTWASKTSRADYGERMNVAAAFNASRSSSIYGNSNTVQQEAIQYPYFIQIATGSETENNIVNDIELNNPFSLFDSKYSDHKLNNLSWLKSEGQWNAKAVYPTAYDELLREYNNPDRLATFNRDAFEVVGSPTITDDGILQPSSQNYVTFTGVNLYNANSWKIKGSFVATNNTTNTIEVIFTKTSDSFGVQLYKRNASGSYVFQGSTNGTSWTWTKNVTSYNFVENIKYFYEIEFTGNAYNLNISTDDINYTTVSSYVTSDKISAFTSNCVYLIGSSPAPDRYWHKQIDLKDFSITVDGVKVFSGAKSKVKLSTEEYTDYDFVLNTADETFRLPLKTKLASGKAVVGNGMTLGLTDGTLNVSPLQGGDDYVFSQSYYGKNLPYNTGSTVPSASRLPLGSGIGVTTDPTKSGIELSDSDLYLYFYVGETVQNANLIDAGRIGEQLVDKLDRSAVKAYIVETYVNGASGYRIWSDGYCEQWGRNEQGIQTTTTSFLKTFKDTNYNIQTASTQGNGIISISTTRYVDKIIINSTTSNFYDWKVSGYLASGQY